MRRGTVHNLERHVVDLEIPDIREISDKREEHVQRGRNADELKRRKSVPESEEKFSVYWSGWCDVQGA